MYYNLLFPSETRCFNYYSLLIYFIIITGVEKRRHTQAKIKKKPTNE